MHEAAATCSWRRTHSHGTRCILDLPPGQLLPLQGPRLCFWGTVMCLRAVLTPAKPLVKLSAQRTLWVSVAAVPIVGVMARAGLSRPPGT